MTVDLREQLQANLGTAYALDTELGGGGMSRVFAATETALNRRVVIKVLPPELAATVNVARFRREVQFTAQLRHPHLVPVLNAGDADGLPYYTMPFVVGESLRSRLLREGELPIGDVVRIVQEVTGALAYAHGQGVVHRDLKPDNILLEHGHAVVTDFAIAKAMSAAAMDRAAGSLTGTGLSIGTPGYMAPEQAAGDPSTDHRADLYALGVVAYEMLVGHAPFAGRSAQAIIAAHIAEQPASVAQRRPTTPLPLARLVMHLLEKRPADRPQSAEAVLRELEGVVTPVSESPPSSDARVSPSATNRRRLWLGVGGLLGLGLAAGLTSLFLRSLSPATPTATSVNQVVVVVPFENRSNAPELAQFGDMIADWVAQGLARTGIVQVVDSRTAIASVQRIAATSAPDASARIRAVAERTNATIVVAGAYYRVGDSVRVQAEILDPHSGQMVRAVDPVAAPLSQSSAALDQVRQKIGGALATVYDTQLAAVAATPIQPPTYDAYLEFTRAIDAERDRDFARAIEHHLRAAQLDPTFSQPLVWAMFDLSGLGDGQRADSIGRALERVGERLTPYDRATVSWQRSRLRCDLQRMLPAAEEGVRVSPQSQDGLWALQETDQMLNRPAAAADVWKRIGPGRGIYANDAEGYSQNAMVLHAVGDHSAELTLIREGRAQFPRDARALAGEMNALAALGRASDVLARVDTMLAYARSEPGIKPLTLLFVTSNELRVHGQASAAKAIIERLVREYEGLPLPQSREIMQWARGLYYNAGQLEKASVVAERLAAASPDSAPDQAYLGLIAAAKGDRPKAERVMSMLEGVRQTFDPGPGYPAYLRARIAASLGDRDMAVRLLQEADAGGFCRLRLYIHGDPAFDGLRDYPAFREFVRPKG